MSVDFQTAAINAISDVVQNRPAPLREFDQIYMKTGDMANTALFVAGHFANQSVVFIGDGDGIALAVMHLYVKEVIDYRPERILVLDFDERIVNSVIRFADHYDLSDRVRAQLYNVVDALPDELVGSHDGFYTNPPWGASNSGESVRAFLERGIEATRPGGLGIIVVGDDPGYPWTQDIVHATQAGAVGAGFTVAEMIPSWQSYHLDDAPDLRSCTMVLRDALRKVPTLSRPLDRARRMNFYGQNAPLRTRYVHETLRVDYGKAVSYTYDLMPIDSE